MTKFKVMVLAAVSVVLSASLSWAVTPPHTTLTPDQAFAQLQAGNAQFVKGRVLHLYRPEPTGSPDQRWHYRSRSLCRGAWLYRFPCFT